MLKILLKRGRLHVMLIGQLSWWLIILYFHLKYYRLLWQQKVTSHFFQRQTVAMLSLASKYFTVCIYFKVGSYGDIDVIILCCQQYCCHDNSDAHVNFAETTFLSKSNNSFNNDNNNNSNKHYLTVNVFSSKVLTDDLVFTSPIGGGAAIFKCSSEPSEGLAVCRAKAVPLFLTYF